MPEQNEWGNGTQYNPDFGIAEAVDGDDYTWPATAKPQAKPVDCRTHTERTDAVIADLQAAVMVLTDEVRQLRQDIARMRTGESEL